MSNYNPERIDTRLERKLDEMSNEIKELHKIVVSLQHTNQVHENQSTKNAEQIEKIRADVYLAKGAINLLKFVGAGLISASIAFGTWVVSSNYNAQMRSAEINQRVSMLERHVIKLENELRSEVDDIH